jgi:hypothetical protein
MALNCFILYSMYLISIIFHLYNVSIVYHHYFIKGIKHSKYNDISKILEYNNYKIIIYNIVAFCVCPCAGFEDVPGMMCARLCALIPVKRPFVEKCQYYIVCVRDILYIIMERERVAVCQGVPLTYYMRAWERGVLPRRE